MADESNNTARKPNKPEPRRPGGKTKRGPNKWLLRIFRGYDAGGKLFKDFFEEWIDDRNAEDFDFLPGLQIITEDRKCANS